MKRIIVFGGNGFVGSQVCRAALSLGLEVTSVNRSGRPSLQEEWVDKVNWVSGDISSKDEGSVAALRKAIDGAAGAVSCVGAFGSNQAMLEINGYSNVNAISIAKQAGIERFTYISTGRSTMPAFVLRGYFEGKIMTEDALAAAFGDKGTILRPGFIFGPKKTPFGVLPLQFIGGPLKLFLELTRLYKMRDLPWLSMALTLPVPLDAVGYTAAAAAAGLLDEIDVVATLKKQDAHKYNGGSTVVFESVDVDTIGNIVCRRHEAETKPRK